MRLDSVFRFALIMLLAVAAVEPAFAQTASPIQTVLQSVIDLLSGTTATVAATLAIMIVGYSFSPARSISCGCFRSSGGSC